MNMLWTLTPGIIANAADPAWLTNPTGYKTTMVKPYPMGYPPFDWASIAKLEEGTRTNGLVYTGAQSDWRTSDYARTVKPYKQDSGKMVSVYVTEWGTWKHGIDGKEDYNNYNWSPLVDPTLDTHVNGGDIQPESVTHLQFAFLPICDDTSDEENWQWALCTVNPCGIKLDYASPITNLLRKCNFTNSQFEVVAFDSDVTAQEGPGHWLPTFENIKQNYPDVKIIMSIGGWTLSKPFYNIKTDTQREKFALSVAKFAAMYPFVDGFDFDYENPGGDGAADDGSEISYFPMSSDGTVTSETALTKKIQIMGSPDDYANYVKFMQTVKDKLTTLATGFGDSRKYELSIAVNCDVKKIVKFKENYKKLADIVDGINMMTYDFSGAWTTGGNTPATYITNQTNLYPRTDGVNMTSVDDAVKALVKLNVPKSKMSVGVAFYARGWHDVTGGTDDVDWVDDDGSKKSGHDWFDGSAVASNKRDGGKADQMGCSGVVQPGVTDYAALKNGVGTDKCVYFYDACAEAPQLSCTGEGFLGTEVYTYDNPRSIMAKGKYVVDNGMRGLFAWAYDQDTGDLLNAMNEAVGNTPKDATPAFPKFPDRKCSGAGPPPADSPDYVNLYVKECGLIKEVGQNLTCGNQTFAATKEWVDHCNQVYANFTATTDAYPKTCSDAKTNLVANHPMQCDCGLTE